MPTTDTRPPVIVSVPVPEDPTARSPPLAHVPLDTVAVPTPLPSPRYAFGVVTLPPVTLSEPSPM
jgi:hypothetical protein